MHKLNSLLFGWPPTVLNNGERQSGTTTLDAQKYAESRAVKLDFLYSVLSIRLKENFCSHYNRHHHTIYFNTSNRCRPEKPCKFEHEEKKILQQVQRRIELKENPHTSFSVSGIGPEDCGPTYGMISTSSWLSYGYFIPPDCMTGMAVVNSKLIDIALQLHYSKHNGSKAIYTVTYIWRPSLRQDNGVSVRDKGAVQSIRIELGDTWKAYWSQMRKMGVRAS
ncbi:hypothetical protein Cgig2_033637 [Carnegiea gigantea]|uniref:Uncharacterized protein n=1 Tax=Carnegiea gigantea TaxID=171969 RepID=A0A9Q1K4C9_9CARY|nr:hypothetical protein Cgig2_033637 [Carnegiea gigantea]